MSLWAGFASQGFLEADACTHYAYAHFALRTPQFFVRPWGRPLFTALYALPASEFGMHGARVTSLLLALLCAAATFRLAAAQGRRWPALAVIFLLGSPLFFLHSFSEMTEIPFATVLVLGLLAYRARRWGAMALLAALLPLGRPEGFALLALAAIGLIAHRRYAWLIVLPVPLLAWDLLGRVLYGPEPGVPWYAWLPGHWPYSTKSLYDTGPLWHFLVYLPAIVAPLALPALWVGVAQTFRDLSVRLRARSQSASATSSHPLDTQPVCDALIVLIPLALLAGHSVLYWRGWMASSGEIRYLLAAAPLWALAAARGWEWLSDRLDLTHPLRWAAIAALLPALIQLVHPVVPFPKYDVDRLCDSIGQWYRDDTAINRAYSRVLTSYAALYLSLDLSPIDPQRSVNWSKSSVAAIPRGTLLVWDPVYGPYSSELDRSVSREEILRAGWIPFRHEPMGWEIFVSPEPAEGERAVIPTPATLPSAEK